MLTIADLPQTLAVFPLSGALLLPRSRLPLHIFEPRYIQMFEDALKSQTRLIGMIQPNAMSNNKALYAIGCAGRITQFSETEDGRFLITLTGISRYHIIEEISGFSPYRKCSINWSGFENDLGLSERNVDIDRAKLLKLLEKYFVSRGLSTDWDSLTQAEDELLVNSLSMLLDFDPQDKQVLLEAIDLNARYTNLITLLEFALRSGEHDDKIQ